MFVKFIYFRSYNGVFFWIGCRGKFRCVVCWLIGNIVSIVVFFVFRNVNIIILGRVVGSVRFEECEVF